MTMHLWNGAINEPDGPLKRNSYYEASVARPPGTGALQGSVGVDVLVVGAGFAGLSVAIELAQRGYSVLVLEAGRICSGASGRNGGQAMVGFASGQGPLEAQLGRADARRVWDMSLQAVALIDERIAQFDIQCERVRGYLHVADSPRKARVLEAQLQLMQRDYGLDCDFVSGAAVQATIQSPRYCAAGFENQSGHMHPLKYGLGLARAARELGVHIFEQSAVLELQRGEMVSATTAEGNVSARFAVLAGNCTLGEYGPRVAPEIGPRIMPVATYMLATAPLSAALCARLIPSNAAVCDNNFEPDYFRFSADHRILFGAFAAYTTAAPRNLERVMRQRMTRVFPLLEQVPIEFVWGGLVDISMNRTPDFGRLADNLYYLQGFSGHGVALTGMAGRLVAEAVAGQAERFDVFARLRQRDFPGGRMFRAPRLALAMWYQKLRDVL